MARKAFQLLLKESTTPPSRAFCAGRLNQLDMIGKPAPAIHGTDLDGKPVSLADLKGNVVLVVFWASWCLPSSAEVALLDQVYSTYQNRGFRVLGINVDTLQNDGPKLETAHAQHPAVPAGQQRPLAQPDQRHRARTTTPRPTASPRSRPTS